MTIGSKITAEKLQSDINREATKLSALSSGEISKYLNTNILEVKKYYLPIKHKHESKLSLYFLQSVNYLKNK